MKRNEITERLEGMYQPQGNLKPSSRLDWTLEDVERARQFILKALLAWLDPSDMTVEEASDKFARMLPLEGERELDGKIVTAHYGTPWHRRRDVLKNAQLKLWLMGKDDNVMKVAAIRFEFGPGVERYLSASVR